MSSKRMTPAEVRDARERAEAATPGPCRTCCSVCSPSSCADCGSCVCYGLAGNDELSGTIVYVRSDLAAARADVLTLCDAYDATLDIIRTLLASAHPHPVEHPTMTAAWAKAREFLGETLTPDDQPAEAHNHFGEVFMPKTCPACAAMADPDGHAADDAKRTKAAS